ncbi:MAG: hypothetical protein EB120_13150 [Proteobacteria bacterium]|nr:hypothetical protein [Pseudomonadota bacterium]
MKKTFTPEVLWEPSATPDAKKIGQQKRGFTFTLIPENSPDHSYKIYYSFTLHRWSVNYYYLSEEGGFIVFDEYERGELVKAAGEPPFFKQLEFDFNDNGG